MRLVPLIALGYGAAYMDRINISFASLRMNTDLGFSPVVYGTGAGLFFISYAFCEIPSNLLLVRFGARRWLARIMLTWGILAIGMMFVAPSLSITPVPQVNVVLVDKAKPVSDGPNGADGEVMLDGVEVLEVDSSYLEDFEETELADFAETRSDMPMLQLRRELCEIRDLLLADE